MSNQPIARGRASVVVDQYQSTDQNGQPVMKNRYATIGRATAWPSDTGSPVPNIQLEIDCMPVNVSGSVSVSVFWDDNQQNQNQPVINQGNQNQGFQNQNQNQGYQRR